MFTLVFTNLHLWHILKRNKEKEQFEMKAYFVEWPAFIPIVVKDKLFFDSKPGSDPNIESVFR